MLGKRQLRIMIHDRGKMNEVVAVITQAFYNFWITTEGGGDPRRACQFFLS